MTDPENLPREDPENPILWSVAMMICAAGLIVGAALWLVRNDRGTQFAEMPAATSSAYNPHVKIGLCFTSRPVRCYAATGKLTPCKEQYTVPFTDSKAGDEATFTLYKDGRPFRTAKVKLPGNTLDSFCVVIVMHEIDSGYPRVRLQAELTRASWRGKGLMPEHERVVYPDEFLWWREAHEQPTIRVYDERLDGDWKKRRAVRP